MVSLPPDPKEFCNLPLSEFLARLVHAGYRRIGQVLIRQRVSGFEIFHTDDEGRDGLETFKNPHDASTIALYDDEGAYRPLKTGPNLRHGWKLDLINVTQLLLALDLIYPAALANWRAFLRGEKLATPLRDTVNRQTGMYRVTGLITDGEAAGAIDSVCRAKCMRHILWPVPSDAPLIEPPTGTSEIPLLCIDACSLLIGEARRVVKSRLK